VRIDGLVDQYRTDTYIAKILYTDVITDAFEVLSDTLRHLSSNSKQPSIHARGFGPPQALSKRMGDVGR
jgi:hypothetical protein